MVGEWYVSFDLGVGVEIEGGMVSFESLLIYMLEKGEVSFN